MSEEEPLTILPGPCPHPSTDVDEIYDKGDGNYLIWCRLCGSYRWHMWPNGVWEEPKIAQIVSRLSG